jgi:type II secretory pathway pseudopilin PulG
MTLIELLIAGVVLVVGMLAIMGVLITAVGNNGRSKVDSTATMLTQAVVEQISSVLEGGGPSTIQDCTGATLQIDYTAAAAPNGAGAPLSNGVIDFTKAQVHQYSMNYNECDTSGQVRSTYDVRWNVTSMGYRTFLVTVGARPTGALPTQFAFGLPVNMRVYVGQKCENPKASYDCE